MKKLKNITGIIVISFLTVSGILFITYFIVDVWDALKVNTDIGLPQSDLIINKDNIRTVKPDDMPPNFNDWASYIHKQLN